MHTHPWAQAAALLILLSACNAAHKNTPQNDLGVHVGTTVVHPQDEPVYLYGLGTAVARYTTTVRAQVDGRIAKVHFEEGSMVVAGDALADLDLRPFTIALAQAKAALARDEALLRNNRLNRDRNAQLLATQLIAKGAVTDAEALVVEADATVAADKAAVAYAQLQWDYAHITAPISGRTGVRLVDPGNVIGASDTNGLVIITQTDPMGVVSTVSEDALPPLQAAMVHGPVAVDAMSRDGNQVLASGALTLIDNQINQATGTLKLKSHFANPNNALWPGQFVRTRFLLQTLHGVLVVPEQAVQRGAEGPFVYVVDATHHVHVRPIKLGASTQSGVEVIAGLVDQDRVVVEGQYRLHDQAAVVWEDL